MAVIVRYAEIALKGKNRSIFEKKLIHNIAECLKKHNIAYSGIKRLYGRIIVESSDRCGCLSKVFGISSFSLAEEVEQDIEKIKEIALKHYTNGSFRISTQRLDKVLGTSLEINQDIGMHVAQNTGAKVELKNPDLDIGIELVNGRAYVFNTKTEGAKGMPSGVEGKVAVLLEDKDSVKAAKLMMKRGCAVVLVKVNEIDFSELYDYAYGFELKLVDKIPENIDAVVTSEKLDDLKERKYGVVVLRPLITS
ncbi:MAG: THUMP domain-containing protein [Candidatus Woesearchaeota archaeon]